MERNCIVGVTPFEVPNADLVIALLRAGARGVLDLGRDAMIAGACIDRIVARTSQDFGVRLSHPEMLSACPLSDRIDTLVLPNPDLLEHAAVKRVRRGSPSLELFVEVTSLEEAHAAVVGGADALIAKGNESGGRVGEATCFVLLQQLLDSISLPVFAQGGIGLHTSAAAIAGGASGVVLDAQLACVRESERALPEEVRRAVGAMDGSETRILGGYRIYTRPDLPVATKTELDAAAVAAHIGGASLRENYVPVGQDGSIAKALADRFATAGGVAVALQKSVEASLSVARERDPLRPGSEFAEAHEIAYPIAQGPMTRVSDRAEFAAAVAEAGGLPFLALALMSGRDVQSLLDETVRQLGDRPWGVGILGFVPADVREAQLEEVRRVKPPFALIAGGRPSQAKALEQEGIPTYLHVPSSGLLASFLKDGARRFIFEGRECGGHVGPRSSFALWEAQIHELLRHGDLSDVYVLFAGGIHDARSAAMVAALSGAIVERGAKVGVLMGSAYILTEEAIGSGAVLPTFQEEVRAADRTVLLETSPGHAIRVLDSPYIEQFYARKRELEAQGASVHEVWAALEDLNLGRLRIATKGVKRDADGLVEVDRDEQLRDGMFMIGQIAAMHDRSVTIAELHRDVSAGGSRFLREHTTEAPEVDAARPLDIAIVGMSGCFPQAEDLDTFWTNVIYGFDAITEVAEERWSIEEYYDPDATGKRAGAKSLSKWGGFLPEIPFDALAYGIPPKSLPSIDPVQLLSLEMARRALADAGYATREFDRSRTAVIFGAESGTDLSGAYGFRALFPQFCGEMPEGLDAIVPKLTEDSFPGVLTNVIAGRIANRLDLGGANFTVDAACATSMAALDQACKELRSGDCDMVLCGAADLHNGIGDYLLFSSVHALSPRGRCRTFDSEADGIALGEGVACIVLKRLEDAERDGDRIYAVMRGSGASSDGRCMGLTAPRPEGQQLALTRAYRQAGISPAEVGLVEAHGTGTVVGDRTELAALTDLYRDRGAQPGSCTLGSVKSQIGHTKCTAGLAGLIKTSLALYTQTRPPTSNLTNPNPYYDAATSPFHFAQAPRPWLSTTRHAAVSAFGFGGSNFHAVLSAYEGADVPARGLNKWPAELTLLRGQDAEALAREVDRLRALLDANDATGRPFRLRDVAFTLSASSEEPVQLAIVSETLDELRSQLDAYGRGERPADVFDRVVGSDAEAKLAFLFPGQGSQRPGMLGDLFVAFPQLQELLGLLGDDLTDVVFPPQVFSIAEQREQQAAVTDTRVAQPALGVADLAVHRLLTEFGVEPDVAAGHSYGELAALCAAGVFADRDLMMLSRERAHAILEAAGEDPGAMAAVQAPAAEVERALEGLSDIVLANDNAPRQIVISGGTQAIDRALVLLDEAGLAARRIPVACAFHSPIVAGAAERLSKRLGEVTLHPPRFPVWANTTGRPYPQDVEAISELLAQQVARPVRFREQIENMYADGVRTFVEAGPGRVLSGLVKKILRDRPHRIINCDASGEPSLHSFVRALGQLAAAGHPVSSRALFSGRGARRIDAAEMRKTRPHYRVTGYTIRQANGQLLEGAMMPANQIEPQIPTYANGDADTVASERDRTVQTYLRSMREMIAAQRDVMLGYLGTAQVPVAQVPMVDVTPLETPGIASGAGRRPATQAEVPAPQPAPAAEVNPAPVESGSRALRGAALLEAVLEIVAERTGYPTEMLDPDLDLEADLSIDSIKRMEILAELAERVDLPGSQDGEMDEGVVEELARLKTLREVVSWIDSKGDDGDGASAAVSASGAQVPGHSQSEASGQAGRETDTKAPVAAPLERAPDTVAAAPGAPSPAVPAKTQRYRFERVAIDRDLEGSATPPAADALEGRVIRLLGGSEELRKALELRIESHGGRVVSKRAGDPIVSGEAWIHLGPLGRDSGFGMARLFAELQQQAVPNATRVLIATGLGGDFGYEHDTEPAAEDLHGAAGVRGLVRTFAREFPDLHVRAVDLDPAEGAEALADALLRELLTPDGFVDVGYRQGLRQTLQLTFDELDRTRQIGLDLGPDSVLLVTGGARGIGARSALAIARETGCHVEIFGRSPLSEDPEPAAYAEALDAPSLRRAILAHAGLTRPAEVEAETRRILTQREIRENLAALERVAASVTYHVVDVRDSASMAEALRELYERRGRIDGVIHAAGILEDKLIRDKAPDSFRRVFDTKVSAMRSLMQELRSDVGFVVCFGSVAGAFGNRGQVDYASANEALAVYGRQLARTISGRVVTVAWGPWGGGGMVTPELEREYDRRGIGLIDPDDGVACLLDELRFGDREHTEVILMRAGPSEWTVSRTRDCSGERVL